MNYAAFNLKQRILTTKKAIFKINCDKIQKMSLKYKKLK